MKTEDKLTGVLLLLSTALPLCAQQIVPLSQQQSEVDHQLHLILCNTPVGQLNTQYPGAKSAIQLDLCYEFATPVEELECGRAYILLHPHFELLYELHFTALPIISVDADQEIVDEPRVPAHFTLVEADQTVVDSPMGIELHGFSALTYPKKSYRIEFLEEEGEEETEDYALLGMREDDDWVLNAMWVEPLRMRNKVCHELWQRVHQPAYAALEPEARSGVSSEYVELFLNDSYQGVYLLSERVDRKLLKLKKHNGQIRGELYKGYGYGATSYQLLPEYSNDSLLWGGFEWKHPEEEVNWANLYDTVDFVLHSSEFYDEYASRYNLENLLDYFLYINVIRGVDNWAKNAYLAKYNTGWPYFYVPWDLDGVFGQRYSGDRDPETEGMIYHRLFRLAYQDCSEGGFNDMLQQRWSELRTGVFHQDSLLAMMEENIEFLRRNGVYEREAMVWPWYQHSNNDFSYVQSWLAERLGVLDGYFSEDCGAVDVEEGQPALLPEGVRYSLRPNPVCGSLAFRAEQLASTEVRVYDLCGRLVYHEELQSGRSQLEIGHLCNGMYLMQASQHGRSIGVQKIMVIH